MNKALTLRLKAGDVGSVLEGYSSIMQDLLEREFIPVRETMEKLFPDYYAD